MTMNEGTVPTAQSEQTREVGGVLPPDQQAKVDTELSQRSFRLRRIGEAINFMVRNLGPTFLISLLSPDLILKAIYGGSIAYGLGKILLGKKPSEAQPTLSQAAA